MDSDFTINEHQADAYKRLNRALNLGGSLNAGDLLGANTRAHITRPMTASGTARTLFGLRQTSTHRLWQALVKRCADNPRALGFLRVDGGLRGLGEELGIDHTTLSRRLKAWETRHPPLVMTGYEQRSRARESLALIQIPLLTEWLLWTAEARARWLGDQPEDSETTQIAAADSSENATADDPATSQSEPVSETRADGPGAEPMGIGARRDAGRTRGTQWSPRYPPCLRARWWLRRR